MKLKDRGSVSISDLNSQGEGIGRVGDLVCFVPGALPGETALIEIEKISRRFIKGKIISREIDSPYRVEPECHYFNLCGGCQLQHLVYHEQLSWKRNRVYQSMKRIAGIETVVHQLIPMNNPFQYRNKAVFHSCIQSGNLVMGFYQKNSRKVTDVNHCTIQAPPIMESFKTLKDRLKYLENKRHVKTSESQSPLVINATIRSSFADLKTIIILEYSEAGHLEILQQLANSLQSSQSNSLEGIVIQPGTHKKNQQKLFTGKPCLTENIGPYCYRISANSFFQVNPVQSTLLFEKAIEYGGDRSSTAYELYCGTGSLSLYIGESAKYLHAIDSNPDAIEDAKYNARLNGINNISFIKAKAENATNLLEINDEPGVVFLDPPRKGCSRKILDTIGVSCHNKVIYVSCDPATLARDAAYLKQYNFMPREIQPFDMFPHTTHVECVALFGRP